MKIIERVLRHGEVYIDRIDALPDTKNMAQTERDERNRPIIGHSESGHHHVIDGNLARAVDYDEFHSFVEVREPCKVVHLKTGPDRHSDAVLPPGNYLVTRQREYTPEGFRRAAD